MNRLGQFEFRLPELGEGLHEGRISRWLVQTGDTVKEDDPVAEVENDKALVELPSPVDGKVVAIAVDEGTVATVGDLLVTFSVEGSGNVDSAPAQDVKTAAVEGAGLEPVTDRVDDQAATAGTVTAGTVTAGTATAAAPPAADAAAAGNAGSSTHGAAREVLAAPGVRKHARDLGIDIAQVTGTGADGKITKEDVDIFRSGGAGRPGQGSTSAQTAAATDSAQTAAVSGRMSAASTATQSAVAAGAVAADAAAADATQPAAAAAEERIDLPQIRRLIAQAMAKSAYTAPHVTVMDEADVTALVELRAELKADAAARDIKLTYLPFLVKAMIGSLRRHPTLNAMYDEEHQQLVVKHYYHIGIATDTERGLMVPVVRDADRKSMWQIATEIGDLAARARTNKLAAAEMKGSTISITNIGSAGGMFFTPIINYPELAILGLGRITERPTFREGVVVPAKMMAISLSFDHRMVDGALAQHFINDMKRLLENPRLLLMEV